MSEAKHTKGPFAAGLDLPEVANNNPDKRLVWANSLMVTDCRTPWISGDEAEANAALFAAAPDLLAVARLWKNAEQARTYIPDREKASWDELMAATVAAIAKATP